MKRLTLLATATTILLLGGLWLARDGVLGALQGLKFGDPRNVCLNGVNVSFDPGWRLEQLMREHAATASLYGLLPIPADWASSHHDASSVKLRRGAGGGGLTVYVIQLPTSKALLVESCLKTPGCQVRQMRLGEPADVVHNNAAGGMSSMNYLDRPVTLSLDRLSAEQVTGIRLSRCAKPG